MHLIFTVVYMYSRVAVDPAALSLIKQQERYTKWAEQQIKNAEKQLGTAGK